jgi:hypothetical protein
VELRTESMNKGFEVLTVLVMKSSFCLLGYSAVEFIESQHVPLKCQLTSTGLHGIIS